MGRVSACRALLENLEKRSSFRKLAEAEAEASTYFLFAHIVYRLRGNFFLIFTTQHNTGISKVARATERCGRRSALACLEPDPARFAGARGGDNEVPTPGGSRTPPAGLPASCVRTRGSSPIARLVSLSRLKFCSDQ